MLNTGQAAFPKSLLAVVLLLHAPLLQAGELHDILARSRENMGRLKWVKCVSETAYGAVKDDVDPEEAPIMNVTWPGRTDVLREAEWTPAQPISAQLWIKRGEVERFEEQRFDARIKEVNLKPNWAEPFGSERVLSGPFQRLKLRTGDKGGNAAVWDTGDRRPYDTPFEYLGVGGSGRGLNFQALVKLVDEGKFQATIEHRKSPANEPRIRVFFQVAEPEQDQIATWTYDLDPAHGMLPTEIRNVFSKSDRSNETRYLVRHKEVPGAGWFPVQCTSVSRSDAVKHNLRSVTRSRVVTSSFEKPTDEELRVTIPQGCEIIFSMGLYSPVRGAKFSTAAEERVDIDGVADLIERAKIKSRPSF